MERVIIDLIVQDPHPPLTAPPDAEKAAGRRVTRVTKVTFVWNVEEQRWVADRIEGVATYYQQPAPLQFAPRKPRRR